MRPPTRDFTLHQREMAEKILQAQGRQRFLTDMDRSLTATVLRDIATYSELDRAVSCLDLREGTRDFTLTVSDVPATSTRRFDYAALEAAHPDLYAEHVTVTEPDRDRVMLTFPNVAPWIRARAEGWDVAATEWHTSWPDGAENTDQTAGALFAVRNAARTARSVEDKWRRRLERDILRGPYAEKDTYGSVARGVMRTSPAAPRRSIDLDAADEHPVLSQYVKRTPRAAYRKVWFRAVGGS